MKTEKYIKFTVPGAPQGKMRSRSTRSGHHFTPHKQVVYETLVALEFEKKVPDWQPWEGSISVDIYAYYSIPKSMSKIKRQAMISGDLLPTKKPDIDNVQKSILDGLNGVAWADDSAVTDIRAIKRYDANPHVDVIVYFKR